MLLSKNNERMAVVLGCGIAATLIVFAVFAKYNNNTPSMNMVYENVLEKKKAIAQLRIHLLKSVEMEKNAVMAITDQESADFAAQSRVAAAEVGRNLNLLRTLVSAIPMPQESKLLDEFATCWQECAKVDQIILQLAVENTNLKAAALSREKGGEIVRRLEGALEHLRASFSESTSGNRLRGLTDHFMIAVLKLVNLHSTHIAEAESSQMEQIEQHMRGLETEAANDLAALGEVEDMQQAEALSQAITAFAELGEVNAEVVRLSRQNSNIKSLELSLGRKRKIAAQCDEVLVALQESMHNKTLKATR